MLHKGGITFVRKLSDAIFEHCLKDIEPPGDGLRRIIKHGLKTGYFPLSDKVEFFTLSSINALLEIYKRADFYDFDFIVANQGKLLTDATPPKNSLELIYRLTGYGYFNSGFVLNVCANIIENNGINILSTHEKLQLINALARQRIDVPPLIELLSASCDSDIDEVQYAKRCRALSELGLHSQVLPSGGRVPDNTSACIDICMATILQNINAKLSSTAIKTVHECLQNIQPIIASVHDMPAFVESNALLVRNLQIIRYAIQFCMPELYSELSDGVLQSFAKIEIVQFPSMSNGRCRMSNSDFVEQLGQILFKSNIAYTKYTQVGPFVADILERDSKVIWLCNGPIRFYATSPRQITAFYELQRVVFSKMGYTVVEVPYWHWKRMHNRKVRSNYCKTSRHLALHDIRESTQSRLGNSRDPTSFNSKSSAELQSRFLGETVFKKEQPKNSWSWHRPVGNTRRVTL